MESREQIRTRMLQRYEEIYQLTAALNESSEAEFFSSAMARRERLLQANAADRLVLQSAESSVPASHDELDRKIQVMVLRIVKMDKQLTGIVAARMSSIRDELAALHGRSRATASYAGHSRL